MVERGEDLRAPLGAFRETDLKRTLDGHGVDAIATCGAMGHMGVGACTYAANDLGCRVTIPAA